MKTQKKKTVYLVKRKTQKNIIKDNDSTEKERGKIHGKIVSVKEDIDTNKDLSAEEVIKNAWAKKPSSMDSYEFYHLMRNENYDGSIIKTVIGVV